MNNLPKPKEIKTIINNIEIHLKDKDLTIFPNLNELRDLDQIGNENLSEDMKETYLYKAIEEVGIELHIAISSIPFYEYRLLIDRVSIWEYSDRALYNYLKEMPNITHTIRVQMGNTYYEIRFKYTREQIDDVFALLIISNIMKPIS